MTADSMADVAFAAPTTTKIIKTATRTAKRIIDTKRCGRICLMSLICVYIVNNINIDLPIPYDKGNDTKNARSDNDEDGWSDVKLAIYMTTHLTETHISFLPCWNHAIRHMRIFRYADLILYISTEPPPEVLDQLPFRNVVVKRYENPGYQEGAIKAMMDPFLNEDDLWFEKYDWVIRVNPDVLIRSDTWLIQTMLNTSIDAIVHECDNRKLYPPDALDDKYTELVEFHTDFTAFRPDAIDRDLLFAARNYTVAEDHISNTMRNIYNASRFVYVEGAVTSYPGHCRIAGIHSPVVHAHDMYQFCPEYYSATDRISY